MDKNQLRSGKEFYTAPAVHSKFESGCFWYLLHWQWVKGQPQLATKLETPGMIALTSGRVPVYTMIPHEEVWVAHHTLGVWPAPNGNYRKEGAFLLDKANQYASCLSISNLLEMDMFIFHHSTYVLSMTYSLLLMTFTPTKLNKIQRKVIQSILNKLGVNKSFPCRVAFSPKDLCGLALLDVSIDQGVHQIQHFLNHVFAADSVGNLILTALQCLQLKAGCSFHILEHPNEYLPYITSCWLTSIRDFLAQHKIVLNVTEAWLTLMSHINDRHLMDDFCSLGIFNNDQLYDVNLCRLYLQVMTLSDITMVQETWSPMRPSRPSISPIDTQSFTGQDNWCWQWHNAICGNEHSRWHTPCLDKKKATSGKVDWAPYATVAELLWPIHELHCCINTSSRKQQGPPIYRIHCNYLNTAPCGGYSYPIGCNIRIAPHCQLEYSDPSNGHLLSVVFSHSNVPRVGHSWKSDSIRPSDFHGLCWDTLKPCPQAVSFNPVHSRGEQVLHESLLNNKILKIGTDGSLHKEKQTASFSWILIGMKQKLVEGAGPVDGVPQFLSSTRAELFGIAALNEFLHHFMEFHKIASMSKVIKCVKNRAAISRINKTQWKGSKWHQYSNDVDIMMVIVDRMKTSTLQHCLRWVKAHQDGKRPYGALDIWGQMNCDADQVATKFRGQIDNGKQGQVHWGGILHGAVGGVHHRQWQEDHLTCSPQDPASYSRPQAPQVLAGQARVGQSSHLEQHRLVWSEGSLFVTWSSSSREDLQVCSRMAQHWLPKVKDLSRCCRFAQVSPLSGAQWNTRAHSHVSWHPCSQEML